MTAFGQCCGFSFQELVFDKNRAESRHRLLDLLAATMWTCDTALFIVGGSQVLGERFLAGMAEKLAVGVDTSHSLRRGVGEILDPEAGIQHGRRGLEFCYPDRSLGIIFGFGFVRK
jgi:hypothetical protein